MFSGNKPILSHPPGVEKSPTKLLVWSSYRPYIGLYWAGVTYSQVNRLHDVIRQMFFFSLSIPPHSKSKSSKGKSKSEPFVWTDDEVDILLSVILEYTVARTTGNVDWKPASRSMNISDDTGNYPS